VLVTTPEEPLPSVGDRYVLIDQLGGDSRYDTWRGHDDHTGRQVVVTRCLEADGDLRSAFGRRARQLEALSDPGIASTLAHDENDDHPWLVSAYVEGDTAQAIADDPGLTSDDALAVIGQSALALAAAHSAGVGHGRLTSARIQVRPDGSVGLVGFAIDRMPPVTDDFTALALLARQLLGDSPALTPDVTSFATLLEGGDWQDAKDIGRTALALAAAQRAGGSTPLVPDLTADSGGDSAVEPNRPWYDDEERKRVRNRLIALGVIVVLGGAALLRIFTAGSGETSVPSVIGEPYVQAQHDLNEVGLRGSETVTTGPAGTEGTVIAQDPGSGQQAKVGSVVAITVAATGP
jgi:serine/threonine protein kinase